MNIFFTNTNPEICAQEHVDRHCVKMILEYAQLLSTAHRVLDGVEETIIQNGRNKKVWSVQNMNDLLYKATHINHPSALWCRQTADNYVWLATLLEETCKEYTHRYSKTHKTEMIGLVEFLTSTLPENINMGDSFTPPTLAMPDEFKDSDHTLAYQNYILIDKAHILSWKNRTPPKWYR